MVIDRLGELKRIMNIGAAETFDPATDSLEAIANALGIGPSVGLWMFGIVDATQVASLVTVITNNLQNVPNDLLEGQFWMQVIYNDSAPATAPEGEIRRITNFVQGGALQTFTVDGFTANVEAGDIVAIFHESLLTTEILARGTLDTSSATVPEDSTRTEGVDYFKGCLLLTTEGAVRFQPRRIVTSSAAGVFTLDPSNPFTAVPGLVDYVIIGGQAEFIPGADAVVNRTPADVIGGKADTIPAMNLAPAATWSIIRHLKAILERLGATPADPDDSIHTSVGQRDTAATADDMSALDTANLHAKIRRVLLRIAAAAYSVTVDPGGAARTDIESTFEDLGAMLAGAAGITTYPAAADIGNGVSMAEAIRAILTSIVGGDDYDAYTKINNVTIASINAAFQGIAGLFAAAGTNTFGPTIAGSPRTQMEAALNTMASYFATGGAAIAATVDPGGASRATLELILEDLGAMLAGAAGITTWPAAAAPGDGISFAEAIREIYDLVAALPGATVMGKAQIAATTIDLNQAAASYDLFTGTTQVVILESLNIKMPTGAAGGALTSISIQTDDVTPGVIISAAAGAVANLTSEADLGWTGALYITVGTKIRLTIGGGAHGAGYVCNVTAKYRAVVSGGNLA
ncbi:hypothetical protein LCGC14_0607470 [marine sediment metagenome]|uniref:Uncharacterized protein n=1 Tax=marine sediment metagenome TaxID=412755 RepID=A0A0F9TUZ9_9ZZZZ